MPRYPRPTAAEQAECGLALGKWRMQWVWSGQWELSAWQNVVITLTMLAICAAWSVKQRYSFVEVISKWLDREFFKIVAKRIGA